MRFLFAIFSLSLFCTTAVQAQISVPTGTGLPDPGGTAGGGIEIVLLAFTGWLLTIFLVLALLAFIITGFMYLFSLGDARSQTLENAKEYFKYAVIAVVLVGASRIILESINLFLRGTL